MNATSHTFSPFRCLSKWLVLPCLLLAAGGFLLGRWLNARPILTIKAVYQGEQVQADIYRGADLLGTTPHRHRGKRGESVSLTLKYEERQEPLEHTLTSGRQERIVEFRVPTQESLTLVFTAFDTMGRRIRSAKVQVGAAKPEALPAPLTNTVGDSKQVEFWSDAQSYKGQSRKSEAVPWQDKPTFDAWVESGLRDKLAALDSQYAQSEWDTIVRDELLAESGEKSHKYPLIFVAPEHWSGEPGPKDNGDESAPPPDTVTPGAVRQGAVRQDTVTPDTPIPYSITSKRRLTEDDVKGKKGAALRLTRNELYARHGRRFSDLELRDYFSKKPWYKPTSDEVMLQGIEDYNAQFLKRHEDQ